MCVCVCVCVCVEREREVDWLVGWLVLLHVIYCWVI